MSDARESARASGNRVMPRSRQDRVAMTGTKKVMRRNTLGSLELMKIQGGMTVVMPIRPRIWMRIQFPTTTTHMRRSVDREFQDMYRHRKSTRYACVKRI